MVFSRSILATNVPGCRRGTANVALRDEIWGLGRSTCYNIRNPLHFSRRWEQMDGTYSDCDIEGKRLDLELLRERC